MFHNLIEQPKWEIPYHSIQVAVSQRSTSQKTLRHYLADFRTGRWKKFEHFIIALCSSTAIKGFTSHKVVSGN
jgi:hypothetical protein